MAAHHGSTPAAWVTVGILLVAFLVGGIALVLDPVNWVMFWVGVVLVPVALIAGKVLAAVGLGSDVEHDARSTGHRA